MPLVGKFAPDGPMLLEEIVLLSFPPVVFASVAKKMVPPMVATVALKAPRTVQLVTVLEVAPLIKRIVDVEAVGDAVVFSMVNALPALLRPFTVTLSAPLKSTRGLPAAMAPLIVRAAPPLGCMRILV